MTYESAASNASVGSSGVQEGSQTGAGEGPFKFIPDTHWIDIIRDHDPAMHSRFTELLGSYYAAGAQVGEKLMHLIWLGADLVATHLMPYGAEVHLHDALENGASVAEVIQVFGIAASIGHASLGASVPIIYQEAAAVGAPSREGDHLREDEEFEDRAAILEKMGFFPEWVDPLFKVFPSFVRNFLCLEYSSQDGLSVKDRELLYVGIYSCPAITSPEQTRLHVRAALQAGATVDELISVVQLGSAIGLHTFTVGMPLLESALNLRSGRDGQPSLQGRSYED